MYVTGHSNQWQMSEQSSPPIDFCVHALLRDGLRVPPFHRHPDGDGSLRAEGLDAEGWQRWLAATIKAQAELNESGGQLAAQMAAQGVSRPDRLEALPRTSDLADRLLRRPGDLCPGTERLLERLAELWADYQQHDRRVQRRLTTPDAVDRSHLWQLLEPYRAQLPGLVVFLVDYPSSAVMPVAPNTCLIAPDTDYSSQAVFAAALLSEAVRKEGRTGGT